jgi:hypothetical protein
MAEGMEKLQGLSAAFEAKARYVIIEMEKLGWHIRIVWGARTYAENQALVVTGDASSNSKHLTGEALDLVDRRVGYSSMHNHKYYLDLNRIAKSVGLVWGGDWISRWDPCHIEMP